MRSFSSLPGLKYGTFFGGTSTLSPVFGLRPLRGSRLRNRKLPNPRSSIFSPRCSASMIALNTVSTMTSDCFLVSSETRDTSSTSSAFVMLPPGVFTVTPRRAPVTGPCSVYPSSALQMIAERRPAGALGLIRVPVRLVIVRLQRPNAQPDLPLLWTQLDDLHL